MKIASQLFLLITTITAMGYFFWYKPKVTQANNNYSLHVKKEGVRNVIYTRLKEKVAGLHDYLEEENFNTTICFFIDMNIHSGKKRLFVYNLEKDSVEMAGLVTHGSGSDRSGNCLYFSNEVGSNCTSLGKYKIGKPYNGKFGLAYKLYGLDKSNSNAFERFVVLHSHSCVPQEEVYPGSICESWGCPTVSPIFLQNLKKIIDASEKPILLKIFN